MRNLWIVDTCLFMEETQLRSLSGCNLQKMETNPKRKIIRYRSHIISLPTCCLLHCKKYSSNMSWMILHWLRMGISGYLFPFRLWISWNVYRDKVVFENAEFNELEGSRELPWPTTFIRCEQIIMFSCVNQSSHLQMTSRKGSFSLLFDRYKEKNFTKTGEPTNRD